MVKIACTYCGKKVKGIKTHLRYCEKAPTTPANVELKITAEAPTSLKETTTTATGGSIEIEQQQGGIIQEVKPEAAPVIVTETITTTKKEEPQKENYIMDYKDVADSVHQSLANLLELATRGKAKVEADDLDRLNRAGAGLLQKYDADGKLMKYSPEIAYVCTLTGIATEIILKLRQEKK